MATLYDYEVSVDGAERKWVIPYARLSDTTPEVGNPALVVSAVVAEQMGGAILSIDADDSVAVIDFTPGKIYAWQVRNVITYAGSAEATFRAINIGDTVYYDASATMPSGVYLSTSPLDAAGAANSVFGHVVPKDGGGSDAAPDLALYPKGTTAASTQSVGVMVRGAG